MIDVIKIRLKNSPQSHFHCQFWDKCHSHAHSMIFLIVTFHHPFLFHSRKQSGRQVNGDTVWPWIQSNILLDILCYFRDTAHPIITALSAPFLRILYWFLVFSQSHDTHSILDINTTSRKEFLKIFIIFGSRNYRK